MNDLEDFLEHIENCSSCYDELATYFIVHKAMQQLDEKQEDTVLDFKRTSGRRYPEVKKIYPQKEFHRAVVAIAFCALIAVLVGFLFL